MLFYATIKNGKIIPNDVEKYNEFLNGFFEDEIVQIEIKKPFNKRTDQQRKSMELYFQQLADALNEEGKDMRMVIDEKIDIKWSAYTVKEHLWRPVVKAFLGENSTTKQSTKDTTMIYEFVNKHVGERTGVHVPWPSVEELYNKAKKRIKK